jgi:hypothetical protein
VLSTILLAVQGPEDNFKGDDEALEMFHQVSVTTRTSHSDV